MMKRICALLAALLLLIGAAAAEAPAAPAEDTAAGTLLKLVSRTEQGDRVVGSGVLFSRSDRLLTSYGCITGGGLLFAVAADGSEYEVMAVTGLFGSDALLLHLSDAVAAEPAGTALAAESGELMLQGWRRDGSFSKALVETVTPTGYRELMAGLLSAEPGFLPGSAVLDAQGNLVYLVIATFIEGDGQYVIFDSEMLAYMAEQVEAGSVQPHWLDVKLSSTEDGLTVVDWSHCDVQGKQVMVFFEDTANIFTTRLTIQEGETSAELHLAPGRSYYIYAQAYETEPVFTQRPPAYSQEPFTVPEGTADLHGFSAAGFLTVAPADTDLASTELLEKNADFSLQAMTDENNRIIVQAHDTYQVTEEDELPSVTVLFAPDGQAFLEFSMYTFMPEIQTGDIYRMDVTKLFRTAAKFGPDGALQPGEYTVAYAIGGQVVWQQTITVE